MRRSNAIAILAVCAAASGCAHGRGASSPATAEVRSFWYTDESGVTVYTGGTNVEQPLADGWRVSAGAVADRVEVVRKQLDPVDQGGGSSGHGHHGADVVSSASPTAGGGKAAREWRFEGKAGLAKSVEREDGPAELGGSIRVSDEPDYRSYAGAARGSIELFQRNTAVSGFLGFGHDEIRPHDPPPGENADWPAAHERLVGGASVSQLLSPTIVVSGGAAVTWQQGTLENPYRRAIVVTTLFPERVPARRIRYTAFAGASWHLGAGTALHAKQGVYRDTWEVTALVPELALSKELGERGLLTVRGRLVRQQTGAFFWDAHYHRIENYRSGDARLGPLTEWAAGGELRWRLGRLGIAGGYEMSRVDYDDWPVPPITGHLLSASVSASY